MRLILPHVPARPAPGPVRVAIYTVAVAFLFAVGAVCLWVPQ